jgi:DNA-binding transcriptional LysR family regulator
MDWNAIKLFLAIVEQGSLAGAARTLDINHSTAYRRLNQFEKAVGSRLFERMSHGYELTPMGQAILDKARQASSSINDLERTIIGQDHQPRGLVKITAPNSTAYRYIPRYLASFNTRYPEIDFEILVSNQELNMTNRQADIAVRATAKPPPHLVGRMVRHVGWSAYCSERYLEQNGPVNNVHDLANHRLIGATGMMKHLPFFEWLDKHYADMIHVRCDDLTAMSFFAEQGHGIALLPNDHQKEGIVKLFALKEDAASKLWVLTHPDLRYVERIRLVMQHLGRCFEQEPVI